LREEAEICRGGRKTVRQKKVRVRVRTGTSTYVGDFLIPPMRNRLSDVLNEEDRTFINLTDVMINNNGSEKLAFVTLNKHMIESMALVEKD
jgi:hypothetical protein